MPSATEVKKRYGTCSNGRGFLVVLKDLSILGIALWVAISYGHYWPISVAIIWCIGIIQFAMGESLLHEASHGHLFRNKTLNALVGNVIGYSIFTTLAAWRTEHMIHHKSLLSDQDHLYWDYQSYRLHQNLHPFIIWVLRPMGGIVGVQWMRSEIPGLFKHGPVFVFYGAIALCCYITHHLDTLFLYWFLPLVWVYSSILYWSEITDHYLASSDTRSNLSPIWNGLFHNGGYHWLHHQYPFVPWYRLKEAHQDLTPAHADQVPNWWGMYQVLLADYQSQKAH